MVTTKWHDKEFEKRVLNPKIVNFLTRLGLRGVSLAKQLISGGNDITIPGVASQTLKAVDTGRLRASLAYEIRPSELVVRIGTNVKYAIFVFLGTVNMAARPILRAMLHLLNIEFSRFR